MGICTFILKSSQLEYILCICPNSNGGNLPRHKKKRNCRNFANNIVFKPVGISMHELEMVILELDEFEAIRLCDHDDKNQIEASEIMHVSRATVQRLLNTGRKKLVDSLLNSKALQINNSQNIQCRKNTLIKTDKDEN